MPYQLSVDQYHEMIRSGVLNAEDRIELLHGWMVPKMSNNPPHSAATELTAETLRGFVPTGYSVRTERPITLGNSEPEPDVAIVTGGPRRYAVRHPSAKEVTIAIEISDSTLSRDRLIKKQIYAEAGIVCYWIVDVLNRRVEVHTKPNGQTYDSVELFSDHVPFRVGDSEPLMISIADLLP